MKRIYLLLLIFPILIQSCLKDDDDVFSDSSSDRVEAAVQEARSILINAENGWKMDMYPSKERVYGGYTLFLKFSETSVTAASELDDADYTENSLWQINKSAGPVLSFDTYNSLIHYFSGPNKDVGNIDTGLGGDYDFIILEATPQKIKLKGVKTGNINYLTPIETGKDWTALMTDYKAAAADMNFSLFEYQINGKKYSVSTSYRTLVVTYYEEDGAFVQKVIPFIYTLTGYKFYEPLDLDGVEVSEMNYKVDGNVEYFEDVNGSGAKLVVVIPPLSTQLLASNWYFAYSGIGTFGKSYWAYVYNNGLSAIGEQLYYAYLGSLSGGYGFCFSSYDGSSLYGGLLGYAPTIVNDNEVIMKFAGTAASNGAWYYNNASFNYYISALGASAGKTYTLTADDAKKPTWIKITDKSNANNTYVLYKTPVYFPYTK